ncbi:MAG TPA: hypothetical protein VGC22_00220 [Chitinophaga sp.]
MYVTDFHYLDPTTSPPYLPDFGIDIAIKDILRKQATFQQQLAPVEISYAMLAEPAGEDDEKEMAYDSIRQLRETIAYCLEHNLALLSFCH